MLAIWLRGCLVCLAAAMVAVAAALVRLGWSAGAAAAVALGALLAVATVPVIIAYAIARPGAWRSTEPKRNRPAAHSAWWAALYECGAVALTYVIIMPFERWWLGADRVGRLAPGRVPVLLVHGYLCNRGLWWWMRRRLRELGAAVATINLEPPFGDIERFAEQLHIRIEALLEETGGDRLVLVGHSMGGLVSRAYLRRYGSTRVAKLITLASPHHGTRMARFDLGFDARQMEPNHPWIQELARNEPVPVPTLSIWSLGDEFVVPAESSRLAGAREQVLPTIGHLSLVLAPTVVDAMRAELTTA